MSIVPTFHTKRLIVRELVESDSTAYNKCFVNYEVIRHLGGHIPWPYPSDGVINYIRLAWAALLGKRLYDGGY